MGVLLIASPVILAGPGFRDLVASLSSPGGPMATASFGESRLRSRWGRNITPKIVANRIFFRLHNKISRQQQQKK